MSEMMIPHIKLLTCTLVYVPLSIYMSKSLKRG